MKYIIDFYNSLDNKEKVTFVGIFFTVIVGLVNICISQKRLGLENITSNRVEWINILRKYVSDFITSSELTNIQATKSNRENNIKIRENLLRTSSLIKLHLNFKGEIDKRILDELSQAIENIYLFLNLRTISNAMNIQQPQYSEGIELYLSKYTDENILQYLIDYSKNNNENTQTLMNEKIKILDLKKIIISEYCSVINGICYADTFWKEIPVQLDTITEKLCTNRNNIIKLTQIYLKAEWIRVNKETKPWPFSVYREKDILKKLEKEWNEVNV